MNKIIDFLKNDLSGGTYLVFVLVSLFFILVIIGYLGDREKLKLESEIKKAKNNVTVKNKAKRVEKQKK